MRVVELQVVVEVLVVGDPRGERFDQVDQVERRREQLLVRGDRRA